MKIKDMNSNNVIRQGDTQPREYQLDTGNLNLNLANKQATIRLMTGDYKGIAYETTATVSSENKISFSIDDVIPAREYRLEITVDDYVFPSRATDGRFDIDPSSHGQEVNIIQIIGKDEIVRDVKEQVEDGLQPFLGEISQTELDRQAQEEARETAEGQRVEGEAGRKTAEQQRVTADAGREAKLTAKADKTYVDSELTKKANKKQEEWITPTLLNGAENHGTTFQFRKTTYGTLQFKGSLKNLSYGTPFVILPLDYRVNPQATVGVPTRTKMAVALIDGLGLNLGTPGAVLIDSGIALTDIVYFDGVEVPLM